MSGACKACDSEYLRPHLRVDQNGSELAATTTSYGRAPADIVRCGACGHMQVAEFPPGAELDEGYSEVSEQAYVDEEEGQRATARRALAQIERHVQRGSICDLGCWVGFLLSEAERRGWQAMGVEPSRFASAFARERLGLQVVRGTLETGDLPEHSFDAVVMADVIEHLPDPGAALERVRGLLRSRAVLYLALPDAGSTVARALGARWWSILPTHVQYFTRSSLARLLTRHGYVVERMDTAPKAFTVRYYLARLEGYSTAVAGAMTAAADGVGVGDRLVWPDFRDRMAVVARPRGIT